MDDIPIKQRADDCTLAIKSEAAGKTLGQTVILRLSELNPGASTIDYFLGRPMCGH
jgi:hypothetical protein